MTRLSHFSWLLLPLLAGCKSAPPPEPSHPLALSELQQQAARFNTVIAVPAFETTTNALWQSTLGTITNANHSLDRIGRLGPHEVNFTNTIRALDDVAYEASLMGNRLDLIQQTSTNAALRETAIEASKVLQEWSVGLDYREDVYRAVKAFGDTKPRLAGEDAKLLEETLRDYRRAGLALPKSDREEVERLRKELSRTTTDFEVNITKAQGPVTFTKAELEGVSDSFLSQPGIKTGGDEYTVMANVTFQYIAVMDNAKREATRKKLLVAQHNLAREANLPVLRKMLETRDLIARKLGYASWADYQIELKMAKTAANARAFLEKIKAGLQPKFDAELRAFQALKAKETGNPSAKVEVWDWRYYSEQLKQTQFTVDAEKLKVYFPYEHVLPGMFRVYETIFGLKIRRVEPPYRWIGDLQLYAVFDAKTGQPLGLFYLDMFPRSGKYNHFAQFTLIEGKLLPSGTYQRPTVALVCNFPPPTPGQPSLLPHRDVETLFHEFGHALHSILTQAKYARFSGTSVPRDFVEAPSQMLENWVWDKTVLDAFAADYRDPSKKIPAETLAKLKDARLATEATFYRRQLSFGTMDLVLHTEVHAGSDVDIVKLSNRVLSDVFLPLPENTAFAAYFGHLAGYDAGYYGYAWADAIAADMATVFEKSPKGYFDTKAGCRLRDEIYAPGDSRDVNVSIEKFLGRPRSIEPFLKTLGIGAQQN
jgi:thimet oligopeptidase